ncbi:MAG: sel1 repeat family protein [Prevotella sp.]|nr:sel1 repeat family protein [Prevotella sp.]
MEDIRCKQCGRSVSEETVACPYCGCSIMEQWLDKAEAGDADAQNFVAWRYHEGDGVEQSDDEAAHWWQRAADQGHIPATNSLGACYRRGTGKTRNDDIAFDLFLKAARQGYATAQFNMGGCYKNGYGVLKMYDEAAKWYKLAADQGDKPAIEVLEKMKKDGLIPEEDEDSDVEYYQAHGDHIDAIMDTDKFLSQYFSLCVQKAEVHKITDTKVSDEEGENRPSKVASLVYGSNDLKFMTLIASGEKSNNIITMYPYMKGYACDVVVKRVIEWGNKIEATIVFDIGDREYACFATEYFYNKDKYIPGRKATLSLAAIGMKVEPGMKGFDFNGQKAVDFLSKVGEKPDYDEQGNVKPLHFSMETTALYLRTDKATPDAAQFQSPATNIRHCELLDIPFIKCDINITNPDEPCLVPLYFRREFFPNIKQDSPVAGWLWLTGQIEDDEMETQD